MLGQDINDGLVPLTPEYHGNGTPVALPLPVDKNFDATNPVQQLALPVIDGCLFVDNSTLSQFVECNRRGAYRIFHRRELNVIAWALEYGRRIHEAMEIRYTGHTLFATEETNRLQAECLVNAWAVGGPEPEGEWRTLDNAIQTLRKYNKQYMAESFDILTVKDGSHACELAFALPLTVIKFDTPFAVVDLVSKEVSYVTELPVFYTGRIDLITRESSGECLITDHKTSSVGGANIFAEYYTGAQMKGYTWASRQLCDANIIGARINVIGCRKPNKTITIANTFFERDVIYYKDSHITEWEENTINLVHEMVGDAAANRFPMRTTQCITKYGKCPYYSACQLAPEQRDVILYSGEYRDVTWDPTADQSTSANKPVITASDISLNAIASIRSFIDG